MHALALHLRYLRSLRAGELTPPLGAELTAPMDTALRAMSVQLTRLLELSRLEAGEARVARRPWPLQELFAALRAQFEPLAAERGLALELVASDANVDTDPRLLQSIVDNLVANAVRCTARGRVRVAARMRRGASEEIVVLDTGAGIDFGELFGTTGATGAVSADGYYEMSGSRLESLVQIIGDHAAGVLLQTGGADVVTGVLTLGRLAGSSGL